MAPPTGETTAAGGDTQPQQQRQAGVFGQTITGIIRIAVFCYFASKFFSPKQKPADPSKPPPHLMSLENDKFNDFGNDGALVWRETNIPYAVWKPASTRTLSMKYYPSEALKNNGSLYAHVFFARSSFPIDPNDPELRRLMGMTWN
ncbi:unnamed protein product [Brassica oleracea]